MPADPGLAMPFLIVQPAERRLMVTRRLLLAGLAALPAAPALAVLPIPPARRLGFRVIRNGSAIGQHLLDFKADGNRLAVRITVELAVGFGPITLYRYRHNATEQWEDGRVIAFQAETNDDGAVATIAMRPRDGVLAVESSQAGAYLAPAGALPATHWNRRMLEGPFINTQTGAVMRPAVTRVGAEPLPWSPNRRAERIQLSGDVDMETWYDDTPAWMGLRFRGRDGSSIHYELI